MEYLTTTQLYRQGFSPHGLRRAVRNDELVRVHNGLYATGRDRGEEAHRLLAAATQLREGQVFSHETAALLLGIAVHHVPDKVCVLGPAEPRSRVRGHRRIRFQRVPPEHLVLAGGLPCTSPLLTMVHLACTLAYEQALISCDSALSLLAGGARRSDGGAVDKARARALLEELPRMRGSVRARQVLADADGHAESPAETLSRIRLTAMDLAPSALQYPVHDNDGRLIGRTDFAWEDERVLGEYDGEAKYFDLDPDATPREVLMREKWREQRLRDAGWVVVRWGKRELSSPALLGRMIRDAMDSARRHGLAA